MTMTSNSAPDLSIGDSNNETSLTLRSRAGAHIIRALNQVNPEILLVHQSRAVGFHLVVKSDEELKPVDRRVKEVMLRDISRQV